MESHDTTLAADTPQIELHPSQSQIFRTLFMDKSAQHVVTIASRGFGKSIVAGACALKAVEECTRMPPGTPNRNIALIAPTHQQAIDIYYPMLAYQFGVLKYCTKSSRANGTFWFGDEVLLKIWSAEASERMRGTGQYFVVNDEFSSWELPGSNQQEAWESTIKPCIDTRWPGVGRSLTISTPKGMDYLYDMYQNELRDKSWKSFHFTYKDSPYLSNEAVEQNKILLDPLKFAREYEASFEDSGARVFYNFNRKLHLDEHLDGFSRDEDVHVAIDFNVGVMATVVFAVRGSQMHILEDFKGHRDTQELADYLSCRFKGHRVIAYPDPTGKARKSSAGVGRTDFSILQAAGIHVLSRRRSPPIIDSVSAVNTKLLNAREQVEIYIHPNCINTIKSLERTVWLERNPDSAMIDKNAGDEHHSDAIRYAVEYLWPVVAGGRRTSYNPNRLI